MSAASSFQTLPYREKLVLSAGRARSIFCLGIDPMPELFPEELRPTGTDSDIGGINTLVHTALEALEERGLQPAAFKPNIGYFTACDRPLAFDRPLEERFAGSLALAEVIRTLRDRMPDVPLILDSKRGDIARSSDNYAREAFQGWQADAVTVSPWMGDDSVGPFLGYRDAAGAAPPTGVYLLVRTSNPGAARFQNATVDGRPLYRTVLDAAREWAVGSGGGPPVSVGAVVGATAPMELGEITESLRDGPIPLLIPGVGRQGGSAADVLRVLRETAYPTELVRVNVSSGVLFPWAGSAGAGSASAAGVAPRDWRRAVRDALLKTQASLAMHERDIR